MDISRFCDNMLSNSKVDETYPIVNIPETHTGYQAYGTVINVVVATASSVIAPYLEKGLTLKVMKPDGSFAKSEDGVLLDGTCPVDREYFVKLEEIGFYMVLYTYVDQNGNIATMSYSPIVKDTLSPVIEVEGMQEGEVVTAKCGTDVAIAKYTVSDDISEVEMIKSTVYVIDPSSYMHKVTNGGTFYAKQKGDYKVTYYAYDAEGNFTTFMYVVRVS